MARAQLLKLRRLSLRLFCGGKDPHALLGGLDDTLQPGNLFLGKLQTVLQLLQLDRIQPLHRSLLRFNSHYRRYCNRNSYRY